MTTRPPAPEEIADLILDLTHAHFPADFDPNLAFCLQDRAASMFGRLLSSAERLPEVERQSADDIRAQGWAVAIHNDYRQNGEPHTFWLFTKDNRCVKGEGKTDAEALDQARAVLTEGETDAN